MDIERVELISGMQRTRVAQACTQSPPIECHGVSSALRIGGNGWSRATMPASISTSQMTRRCSSRALGRWCLRRKLNATRQLAEQCRGRRSSGLTVTGAPHLAQVIEVGRAVGIALIPPAHMVPPDYANSIASKG